MIPLRLCGQLTGFPRSFREGLDLNHSQSLSAADSDGPIATQGSIFGSNLLDEGSRMSIYLHEQGFEFVIDLVLFLPARQMTSMIKEEDLMTDESY